MPTNRERRFRHRQIRSPIVEPEIGSLSDLNPDLAGDIQCFPPGTIGIMVLYDDDLNCLNVQDLDNTGSISGTRTIHNVFVGSSVDEIEGEASDRGLSGFEEKLESYKSSKGVDQLDG